MSQLMYSPFGALNELHRELNTMFDDRYGPSDQSGADETGDWVPEVDIKEDAGQFTLPQSADNDGIKAKASNGVLEISIPKARKEKPINISVEG